MSKSDVGKYMIEFAARGLTSAEFLAILGGAPAGDYPHHITSYVPLLIFKPSYGPERRYLCSGKKPFSSPNLVASLMWLHCNVASELQKRLPIAVVYYLYAW